MKKSIIILIFICFLAVILSGCVAQSIKVSDDLESAVRKAVLSQLDYYYTAEARTEGHIILSVENKGDKTIVYAIASCAYFGFENDYFTVESGCGAIPAVIEFARTDDKYELLTYTEPEDGENNYESTKVLFPATLWASVLNSDSYYPELQSQQEEQARAYVKSIGRDEKVTADYVEKTDFHISDEASNILFCLNELCDYPLWIGTQEYIESGVRYIYEAKEEDFEGYTIITFTKKNVDGNITEQLKYKITGDTVEKM